MPSSRGLVVVAALLATVLTPVTSSADGPKGVRTSYTVLSRTGGAVHVAAREWLPHGATTVLLGVHGLGAVKDNTFGRLAVRGYSLGEHQYAAGRATVAIDLPGYGESGGNPYLAGLEDFAFVLDQLAQMLRVRFEHVVGVGHSLGAALVALAQGAFGSFDAIVPAAYVHADPPGGVGVLGTDVVGSDRCAARKGSGIRKALFTSYADPRVVEDFMRWLRPPKPTFGESARRLGPVEDDLTARVAVPVLVLLGGQDCVLDTTRYAEEPSHYPLAPEVRVVVLPRAGHAVFHHLDHRRAHSLVSSWLGRHEL